jgi:hypothetical protein
MPGLVLPPGLSQLRTSVVRQLVDQLTRWIERLGYHVTLEPVAAA